MPDQESLQLWPRDHDLPPRWDGLPVEWGEWTDLATVFICPPPRRPERCGKCKSERPSLMNVGRVSGAGRQFIGRLTVFRCPDCRHDSVRDHHDRMWDLDPTDYTDDGSYDVTGRSG
ncbi:hypothetical protein ORI20_13895 [Mycobacterium sp. CVI_P3]|uniref:Transposase n=1 Tax=Mycobacterium pinniadriaticum TaxID=2994102 RepID=A0ABT3SE56_9MYCO|nr:hypothetical protein [Mycobacterium pinniadriaticum]MCX2931372.1 hypothetical protein [Mycobacterium pinniadriaticum]MCX2937796.1 hypothetical protein [Mycobacterium pinniadriaticum]